MCLEKLILEEEAEDDEDDDDEVDGESLAMLLLSKLDFDEMDLEDCWEYSKFDSALTDFLCPWDCSIIISS